MMLSLGDHPTDSTPPLQLIGYRRAPSRWRTFWLTARDIPAAVHDRIGGDEGRWARAIPFVLFAAALLVIGYAVLTWAGHSWRVS